MWHFFLMKPHSLNELKKQREKNARFNTILRLCIFKKKELVFFEKTEVACYSEKSLEKLAESRERDCKHANLLNIRFWCWSLLYHYTRYRLQCHYKSPQCAHPPGNSIHFHWLCLTIQRRNAKHMKWFTDDPTDKHPGQMTNEQILFSRITKSHNFNGISPGLVVIQKEIPIWVTI